MNEFGHVVGLQRGGNILLKKISKDRDWMESKLTVEVLCDVVALHQQGHQLVPGGPQTRLSKDMRARSCDDHGKIEVCVS